LLVARLRAGAGRPEWPAAQRTSGVRRYATRHARPSPSAGAGAIRGESIIAVVIRPKPLLLLAFLVALAFQPVLAGIALACPAPGHQADNATITSHVHADAFAQHRPMTADAHVAAPGGDHHGGHLAGCGGCGEAGSYCCSSLFLVAASVSPTRAPPGAREISVDEALAIASRPFDGPFRPPRTLPL
jgi:hypothetical protein